MEETEDSFGNDDTPNNLYSDAQAGQNDAPLSKSHKLRKFFKHVLLAAKKQEEQEKAKQGFERHITKIKRLVSNKAGKESIIQAIEDIDDKLNDVLDKEGKLISTSLEDSALSKELKLKVSEIENRLNEIGDMDIKLIESVKKQILSLENELSQYKNENKKDIDNIINYIPYLKSQLNELIAAKEEREKKMLELEEKIKRRVSINHDEIMRLEKQIAEFESKFDRLAESGIYDSSILNALRNKITKLKQKLFMRKAGISHEQEKFLEHAPTIKSSPVIPKQEEKVKNPLIKHDIHFNAPSTRQSLPGELPPLPPMPEELRKR